MTTGGIISLVAGNVAGTFGYASGVTAATGSYLQDPYGLAFDAAGNLYIADEYTRAGGCAGGEHEYDGKHDRDWYHDSRRPDCEDFRLNGRRGDDVPEFAGLDKRLHLWQHCRRRRCECLATGCPICRSD